MERVNLRALFCAIFAILVHSGAAQTVHVVGDRLGWTIPPDRATYSDWALGKIFRVGDILQFNFATNRHDVVRVPKTSFDICSDDDDIGEDIEIGPASYTLTAPGDYYFISRIHGQCQAGQKLAINVVSSTPGGANRPVFPPTIHGGRVLHIVGDNLGWTIPPNATYYQNWASSKVFRVWDILVFNFASKIHDVVRVTRASYYVCSDDDEIGEEIEVGPASYSLTAPGEYYFISSIDGHCHAGQKLAITAV